MIGLANKISRTWELFIYFTIKKNTKPQYLLHTLIYMSYVYLLIFLKRQGNTSTIEAPCLWRGCGRVVYCAGHKARRLVLQCINGVSSNPVEGRTQILQLNNIILTLFGLIFRHIYIYMSCTCYSFVQVITCTQILYRL